MNFQKLSIIIQIFIQPGDFSLETRCLAVLSDVTLCLYFIIDIVMEEAPTALTLAPPVTTPTPPTRTPPSVIALPPPTLLPPPPPATQPERDGRRSGGGGQTGGGGGGRLGLTKEVLSAHTQQEEQTFLDRFKDLSKLRVIDQTASSTVHCHNPTANANAMTRGRDANTL